jgi:SWIM zinc finger
VSLTRERIESLAPDQASLAAALKLVKRATWPVLAANDEASVLWGECQGSGATPYRVVVSPEDTGYKCTCPSRKFPCKHVLAVLWLRVDRPERFENTSPPQWVEEWRARRRSGARPLSKPKPGDGTLKELPSFKAALAAENETA